jgi:hypothetical protein
MLHAVRHLIRVDSADHGPAQVRTSVTARSYKSAGGERDSAFLDVPNGGGMLRVEAQRESFALMWPSPLDLPGLIHAASSVWWSQRGTATLISSGGHDSLMRVPMEEALRALEANPDGWAFARIDFPDRALTWAEEYRDLERSGSHESAPRGAHEVSLSAPKLDVRYVQSLISNTAVPTMQTDTVVADLMGHAQKTLAAYT